MNKWIDLRQPLVDLTRIIDFGELCYAYLPPACRLPAGRQGRQAPVHNNSDDLELPQIRVR